jgi:tetratricopeptide (TPR) repeat protein
MTSEKFDSAIYYYDSALKQDPSNLNSQFNRGLCYLYFEKYKSAINDFENYIKTNKNDPNAYSFRAECKRELGDSTGSLKDYDTAVLLSPNDPKLRIERGKFRSIMSLSDLSNEDFDFSIKLDSTQYYPNYLKALNLFWADDYNTSILYFSKAIKLNPTFANNYFYCAQVRLAMKEEDNAIKLLNIAIELSPKDPEYYLSRGKVYLFNESEYDDNLAYEDLSKASELGSKEAQDLIDEYFTDDDDN